MPLAETVPRAESVADPFEAIQPVDSPAGRPMEAARVRRRRPPRLLSPAADFRSPSAVVRRPVRGNVVNRSARPERAVNKPAASAVDARLARSYRRAPTAVWYVARLPGDSSSRAGRSSAAMARSETGRGDSLVWRDGWPDWRPAAAVFPQLAMTAPWPTARNQMTPMAASAPIPSRPMVAPQAADDWTEAIIDTKPLQHRHRPPSQQSNVILGISLAIILLGTHLAFVLIRTSRRPSATSCNPLILLRRRAQAIERIV